MTFLEVARKYGEILAFRIPLAKPHFCPICRTWSRSITRGQFEEWEEALAEWERGERVSCPPNVIHRCGAALRCEEPKPITVTELTGETR